MFKITMVNKAIILTLFMMTSSSLLAATDLEKEVETRYRVVFGKIAEELDYSPIPEHYVAPFRLQTGDGELFLADEEAVRKLILDYGKSVRDANAKRAELGDVQVKILNNNTAIIVVDWTITDAKGKLITSCDPEQFFYLLAKYDQHWKVAGESLIDCSKRFELR